MKTIAKARVLIIGGRDSAVKAWEKSLSANAVNFETTVVRTAAEFNAAIAKGSFDAIVCSDGNNEISPMNALSGCDANVPVIILMEEESVTKAAGFMKAGAADVLGTVDSALLPQTVRAAISGKAIMLAGEKEESRFSEEYFRQTFENSFDAVYLLENNKIKSVNARFISMFGIPERTPVPEGINLMELVAPRSREFLAQRREARMRGEELPNRYRFTARRTDGLEFEAEATVSIFSYSGNSYIIGHIADLSDVQKSESALRESQRQLSTLFSNLPGMAYRCKNDSTWTMLLVSEGCTALTGYNPEDFILNAKISYDNVIHPEDREYVAQTVEKGTAVREAFELHYRIIDASGKTKWVHEQGRGVYGADGSLLFLEGYINDVTALRESEIKLRKSVDEWHATFDGLSDGIMLLDSTQHILRCNRAVASIVGMPIKSIIGQTCHSILHELDSPHEACPIHAMMQKKSQVSTEIIIRGRCFNISLDPLMDEKGDIIGAIQIMSDITEEKAAKDELVTSRQRMQLHIEQTPLGVIEWDVDFRVREWNPAAERIFGFTKDEAVGKHARFIIPEEFHEHVDGVWNALLRGDGGTRSSNENITKSGARISCEWFNTPLINAEGITIGAASLVLDTTAQRRAQNALAESEKAYKGLFNTIQQAIYIQDEEGRFLDVNDGAVLLYGYSKEEFIGKFPDFLAAPGKNDFEALGQSLANAFKGLPQQFEFWGKKKNGEIFPKSVHLYAGRYFSRDVIIAIAEDITERKNTELYLKESEEKYRSLTEQLPVGIYRSTVDGDIIFVNPGFLKIFGYTKTEEVLKSNATDFFINKSERDDWLNKLAESGGKSVIHEFTLQRRDGSRLLVRDISNLIFDAAGNTLYIDGVLEDITQQRKAEDTLRKLLKAVDNSPISIVITDNEGAIEYVNPYFTELTGYTFEEVRGKNPRILNSGFHPPEFYQGLWTTILSGKVWTGEIVNRKKNGDVFWESIAISAIFDADNKIVNFVAVKDDITEKKEMIRELINAKERAEEMSRVKSNFLANMSHELRTPMIGILGYSEYLADFISEPMQNEMVQTIHNSGKRLLETLNLILDLSKIEAEKLEVDIKAVEIKSLIASSVELFKKAAEAKNLYLRFIPYLDTLTIQTDERLMREIVQNLVNNAIKFTKSGGVVVELLKKEKGAEDIMLIRVKDTGIGISPKDQQVIFEEFRQASEGLSRSFEGTGLGLTITRKFVHILRGNITLVSEPGSGSIFTVAIPVSSGQTQPRPLEIAASEDISQKSETEVNKPTLLLVEDDRTNRDIIAMFLRERFAVTLCETGESALDLASAKNFDIILMDINLGRGLNGLQVAKQLRLRQEYQKTPFIAVTAFAMRGDKEEFLQNGFSAYLAKPFGRKELLELIQRHYP